MMIAKAIKPRTAFQSSIFRAEVKDAANETKRAVLADYKKTTATWQHKVTFGFKVDFFEGEVRVQVATDDAAFGYTDKGTKRHIIRAKTPKGLLFRVPSKAKTQPNVIGSSAGSKGDEWRNKMQVNHPGTKARNFTKIIKKKYEPQFKQAMAMALNRAAQRSGYSVK